MKVLLLTPWQTPCGIASYAELLVDAVQAADPSITIRPLPTPLGPDVDWADLLVVNHAQTAGNGLHAALIMSLARQRGVPLVVIQHDTFETWAIMQARAFADWTEADALIVHEPVDGLSDRPNVYTWRQGVPAPALGIPQIVLQDGEPAPILGSVGFPAPWKQYDVLAEATGQVGWALWLCAAGASPAQIDGWRVRNPLVHVETAYLPAREIVRQLSGCTATAFLYGTAGSGTSAAIRFGLAARKPLFVTRCRQFRDLDGDPALRVIPGTVPGLVRALETIAGDQQDPEVVRVAARDAWSGLGQRHAELYRRLIAQRGSR